MRAEVAAFAKLNLSLSVLGQRDDGFHEIVSTVQTFDLADDLDIVVEEGTGICVTNTLGGFAGPDLTEVAAALILEAKKACRKVTINISKRIPAGAGLGGGSADAAAVLVALDRMIPPELPDHQLQEIGAEVGSDVPLFLLGGNVRVSGRGEHVVRGGSLRGETFLLLFPPVHSSTVAVYDAWSDHRPGNRGRREQSLGGNDLLQAAFSLYPILVSYYSAVQELGAAFAGMSGSGASFFAAFESEARAREKANGLAELFPKDQIVLCHSTDRGQRITRWSP
jgi:4-diphosphocytidyl-2-C-methyl-D-erythritol kinase